MADVSGDLYDRLAAYYGVERDVIRRICASVPVSDVRVAEHLMHSQMYGLGYRRRDAHEEDPQ